MLSNSLLSRALYALTSVDAAVASRKETAGPASGSQASKMIHDCSDVGIDSAIRQMLAETNCVPRLHVA